MKRTQKIASGNVGCQLQDNEGNLWFSTGGEGIYRFNGSSFTNFTTKDGLCNNHTGDMIQDRSGNILIGTGKGICKYDRRTFTKYFETDSLNNLEILSLFEDRDGNLWFSAMGKGLYRYDGGDVTRFLFKYDHPFFGSKEEHFISDIIQDRDGNIWFSSFNRGGVWRYDGKNLIHFLPPAGYYSSSENEGSAPGFLSVTSYVSSPDHIIDDMVPDMAEDKAGNIWFATRRHGACRYDGKTFTGFGDKEEFVSYGIRVVLQDSKGIMWFGTERNGVFSYDGKTFRNYTMADGLVNNSVCSMLEDKDGNLWLGTRAFGLSRYDGRTFTTFSE